MSSEQTGNSSLLAVLSILAILAISLVGGVLLMQGEKDSEFESNAVFSSDTEEKTPDEFDPIDWARGGAEYPPLDEEEAPVTDDTEIKDASNDKTPESVAAVERRGDELASAALEKKPVYQRETGQGTVREVREDMYWVQVVATRAIVNAERVRDDLAAMGLPVRVFTKDEEGVLIYRVRVGPFTHRSEAENSVSIVHEIDDFGDSYVTVAPVTKYIED